MWVWEKTISREVQERNEWSNQEKVDRIGTFSYKYKTMVQGDDKFGLALERE